MLKPLVSLLFFLPFLLVSQQDIDQAQLNLEQQLAEIDNISAQIQSVEAEKNAIETEMSLLQTDISQMQEEIAVLESEISANEEKKAEQIKLSSSVLVNYQQMVNDNILINAIFNPSEDYSIITRIQNNKLLVQLVIDEIYKSIDIDAQLSSEKESLEFNQTTLTNSQQQLDEERLALEQKNDDLLQLQNETYAYADDIKSRIASMETELEYQNIEAYIPNEQKEALMSSVGIVADDYVYVDYIITHESSWNYTAVNPISGAYGLCQALPGSKMASSGSDWQTNPKTQMDWCNNYAISRYGSWSAAYDFWISYNWW